MLTESARMSSAAEARFRVQAPNSLPRNIKVVALDRVSEPVVERLSGGGWQHATFFKVVPHGTAITEQGVGAHGWLTDLAGQPRNLVEEVDSADLFVMVAGPGGEADLASVIGDACSNKRVNTTALVIGAAGASEEALRKTLAQLRPWSLMVVIAHLDDYIDDMLVSLRAA